MKKTDKHLETVGRMELKLGVPEQLLAWGPSREPHLPLPLTRDGGGNQSFLVPLGHSGEYNEQFQVLRPMALTGSDYSEPLLQLPSPFYELPFALPISFWFV